MNLLFARSPLNGTLIALAAIAGVLALLALTVLTIADDARGVVIGTAAAIMALVFACGATRTLWLKQAEMPALIASDTDVVVNTYMLQKRVPYADLASVEHIEVPLASRTLPVVRLTRRSGGTIQLASSSLACSKLEIDKWLELVASRMTGNR